MIHYPYASVDWDGPQVPGLTHAHGVTKDRFDRMVAAGYRALGFSNYYPSDPARAYPLTNMTGVGEADVTDDIIGIPNAEHHSFTDVGGHVSGFGSMLSTGTSAVETPPDGTGYLGPWQTFVAEFEAELLYPNGGGISLNHPHLAFMGVDDAKTMLAYSELILGIEVYNFLGDWNYDGHGWAEDVWHDILVSGQRCFGFFAPDHNTTESPYPPQGANRLLVPSTYTTMSRAEREQACLEAYREGRWYGVAAMTSPTLTGMTANDTQVAATFSAPCAIKFVYGLPGDTEQRETPPVNASSATYNLRGDEVYVRVVGTGAGVDEISMSQPVMYMDVASVGSFYQRRRARRFIALG